jgi:hypothetical protein
MDAGLDANGVVRRRTLGRAAADGERPTDVVSEYRAKKGLLGGP